VLAKHGFASTLFVSTGWIRGAYDMGGGLDTMLDWDQVRELAGADVEIGGHSHTHPQLDQLDDDALRHELIHCKEIVADELGRVPASFAYPYGYSSRRVREAVRETGYAQALAVGNGLARRRQGPYAVQRVTVRRGTAIEEFERLVEGRAIARNFARDRVLTKGYAMVRRARQVRRKAIRSRV
jgi:peptidoglycan/xylan/chitin deacetylase (PgdA/CDA1 family)